MYSMHRYRSVICPDWARKRPRRAAATTLPLPTIFAAFPNVRCFGHRRHVGSWTNRTSTSKDDDTLPSTAATTTATVDLFKQSEIESDVDDACSETGSASRPDYTTNDGIVEGVWIFCRHGDRTPSRPLSPAHRRNEEGAYWVTKLPVPDSASAFENFSVHFPLENENVEDGDDEHTKEFLDVVRNPFGFLTRKGLRQLHENGSRFYARYKYHGYRLSSVPSAPDTSSSNNKESSSSSDILLTHWDVQVYSTNYLRTVMSAQSFLDGLLGTHTYAHVYDETLDAMARPHDVNVFREVRVPRRDWKRLDHGSAVSCVPVHIRPVAHDPLNAFDRNPALMADLVSSVLISPSFQQGDGKAAPLAARLANILPGLVRPRRADFSARAPSGINWVEAADHFVCRGAHGLPLSRFTDFQDDDRIEHMLASLEHQTLRHLSWRYRQWYTNSQLLGAIAAPPLREVVSQMKLVPQLGHETRRPLVLYSCHDVTILGLLYGMGAEMLRDDVGPGSRFWPRYGSTLVLELVRCGRNNDEDDVPSYVVRVLLNGTPVVSLNAKGDAVGRGCQAMMTIDDFAALVDNLEERGGREYSVLMPPPGATTPSAASSR